jgi:hypothetical protein
VVVVVVRTNPTAPLDGRLEVTSTDDHVPFVSLIPVAKADERSGALAYVIAVSPHEFVTGVCTRSPVELVFPARRRSVARVTDPETVSRLKRRYERMLGDESVLSDVVVP